VQTHFNKLHQREFKKRTQNGSKKARKREYEARKEKFFDAKRGAAFFPEKGNDIKWHLRKCGFECEKVRLWRAACCALDPWPLPR
jgi:hypothetical protein